MQLLRFRDRDDVIVTEDKAWCGYCIIQWDAEPLSQGFVTIQLKEFHLNSTTATHRVLLYSYVYRLLTFSWVAYFAKNDLSEAKRSKGDEWRLWYLFSELYTIIIIMLAVLVSKEGSLVIACCMKL